MPLRLASWLGILLAGSLAAAELAPAAPPPKSPPPGKTSRAAAEKQECIRHLKAIYAAIQAYQADHHDLPNWLSDLVPRYLDDVNMLLCPVCRRTGRTESPPLADPKLPSSYLFEFCPVPLGSAATNAPTRTRREWKRRQMSLLGSDVPLVRCRHHKPMLNLAFDGRIYESASVWELLFTNRVNVAELTPARLFAREAPPARPASRADSKAGAAGPRKTKAAPPRSEPAPPPREKK